MYIGNSASTPVDSSAARRTLLKPFVIPKLAKIIERVQPTRKRKRVSYKNQDGSKDSGSDADSDDDDGRKKKRKASEIMHDVVNYAERLGKLENRKFDVVSRAKFAVPTIRDKQGKIVPVIMSGTALGLRAPIHIPPRPLFDPMSDHAIVLYDPTIDMRETDEERKERLIEEAKEKERAEQEAKSGAQNLHNPHKSLRALLGLDKRDEEAKLYKIKKVAVVIDPRLGSKLRPHQVEGVKFLYKAATGGLVENQYGCIMADEMGLGKTMQCITLLWTLLKQSPKANKPTIEKVVIACPASLVRNWANELTKWLGEVAPGCLPLDGKGTKEEMILSVRRWATASGKGVSSPILIVSYETLRTLTPEIQQTKIGLLLADEGHRLKNAENQTFKALDSLNVQRRVIITGTPIQNDLTEYFSLLNFANPNFLGSRADFRTKFENIIIKGRDADASDSLKEKSRAALSELAELVNKFVIRRTNDLLSKYLPVKYEHVVFCRPSPLQVSLYNLFTSSPEIKKLLRGVGSQPLKAIDLLRKLCNTPQLLDLPSALAGSEDLLPDGFVGAAECTGSAALGGRSSGRRGGGESVSEFHPEYSGKMAVLERFLYRIKHETKEKVVLISNFTQTLDLFEKHCRSKRYGYFRLDGTMPTAKRMKIVDQFNNPEAPEFVFLLSSKAGGCGINLIGANRLVLFDPDWNPASDQQALARIWRDGQKKECFVYRFVTTGTIEEKIFQRQASKQALSASVVDSVSDGELHFSASDLRQLFEYRAKTLCETHDTFKCTRCKNGKQVIKNKVLLYGDASTWNHFENVEMKNMHDDLLRAEAGVEDISFVFQYISH